MKMMWQSVHIFSWFPLSNTCTAAAEESKVKEKPVKQKKVKPPVDYRPVKSGFVDKQGEVYR